MTSDERLHVETRFEPDRLVLELHGELDLAATPLLVQEIERAEGEDKQILVLDLDDLQFIDSAGLRAILAAHQRWTGRGGHFATTPGSEQVQRLLTIAGVRSHLPTVASAGAPLPGGER